MTKYNLKAGFRGMNKIFYILIFSFICQNLVAQTTKESKHFEISKNLEIFVDVFKEIQTTYVNDVDPGSLIKTGIDAMLESLDPYTVYIPESEMEDVKLITMGEYGGIGSVVVHDTDYCVIKEPYFERPAYNAGLRAGDKIMEIDGKSYKGKSTSVLSNVLKGQAGTEVELLVLKPDNTKVSMKVRRGKIKLDVIPYAGILQNKYAYIRFTTFSRASAVDFKKAFQRLQKENPDMEGLIIDIRGNGGGLLSESVDIVDLFVDGKEKVVEVKGKKNGGNTAYYTKKDPLDKDIPIVILVDENSASASEILAGAFQDLDRGIIVGERTFGKGLVQNIIPLSYNAQMKVTVAKYYIPSGRCIQEIDYEHKDSDGKASMMNDSTKAAYFTKNGRKFYNNGGIEADVSVERESLTDLLIALFQDNFFFKYAVKYKLEHDTIASPKDFSISDEVFEDFVQFTQKYNFDYKSEVELKVEEITKILDAEKDSIIRKRFVDIEKDISVMQEKEIYSQKQKIKKLLRMEIVPMYYFQEGKAIALLKDDSFIEEAIALLKDQDKYRKILSKEE